MKKLYTLIILLFTVFVHVNGQITDVVTGLNSPARIIIDNESMYITDYIVGSGQILKIDDYTIPTPIVNTLFPSLNGPYGFYRDGNEVYISESNGGNISKFDILLPTPTLSPVISGINGPEAMIRIGNDLYIAEYFGNQISKIDLTSPTPVPTLVVTAGAPDQLIQIGNFLYYSEFSNDKISKIDLTSPTPAAIDVVTGLNGPSGLLSIGNDLYITEYTGNKISKIDITSINPVPMDIITGVSGPTDIVAVGSDFFIAEFDGNKISKTCIPAYGIDTRTECDSLVWIDGNTYYADNNSAVFNIADGAANMCDSIVTLNLTITNPTSATITETACDSYTSPSGNYTWTSSNTYMDTIPNAANCDSVITVELTITNSTSTTITVEACDSYTSPSGNYVWTSSNTYMDTIPNAANCDSVITIELTINTLDLSVGQAGDDAMANETGATYQWLNCPAMTEIDGATSQTYTATANGDYAVIVTKNGCTNTSDCVSFMNVGINEEALLNGLSVYPNPTNGDFSIDLGENNASVSIQITDLLGRVIQRNTYNEGQLLNLKLDAPKGVYMLTVESGNKKAVVRLVKK